MLTELPRFLIAVVALGWCSPQIQAADISVGADFATIVKLPEGVQTVVVGNPLIADVSVQRGRHLLLIGRSPGITNLIVLGGAGTVILDKTIEVRTSDDGRSTYVQTESGTSYRRERK